MKTYKSIFVTMFILLAATLRADIFVGGPQQPLNFTITTPGYYTVSFSFYLRPEDSGKEAVLFSIIDGGKDPISAILRSDYYNGGSPESGTITVITKFDVGSHSVTNDPLQTKNVSAMSNWSYAVKTADSDDYSQALTDLQTQLNNVQQSITDQGTSLSDINQKLANIESAITTTQAAIQASGNDLNQSFSNQIAALQQQLLKVQAENFNAIQQQLTKMQKSIKHLHHVSSKNTFIGTVDMPLEFTITKPGLYDITLNGNIIIGGLANKSSFSQMTTVIDGTSGCMPSIAAGVSKTTKNGSTTSTHYFAAGPHTISAAIDLWDTNGNEISSDDSLWANTDHSIWSYVVEPSRPR